ncbi:hypothetical protein [Mesorhizobium sp. CN2-181]|uniref:hypothetical protein n=1 Tax=Mesorhizobium yinganensis TaxID=3157707 RepID=UPI0032B8175D
MKLIRELVSRQVEAIKARIAELANVDVGNDPASRSYKQSEIATEALNLKYELAIANKRLMRPTGRKEAKERDRHVAEIDIANRTSVVAAFVERLEAEGDYRQARLWRQHALTIPEQIYREKGLL